MTLADGVDHTIVGVLGAAVGIGELVSRYRDAPVRALITWSALLYVAVNVAAAVAVLGLARAFGWDLGGTGEAARWTQVLAAGFGSMAIFRSALFTVRVADEDVSIGPSGFLQVILRAADRAVDRTRAAARTREVQGAMRGVSFEKAQASLPAFCLALMQNLTPEEQRQLADEIDRLSRQTVPDYAKTLILGIALMNLVGEGALRGAVDALGDQIRGSAPPSSPTDNA
jgi:hypothetical protein